MIDSKFIHLIDLTEDDINELAQSVPLIAIEDQAVIPTDCQHLIHLRFHSHILQHIGKIR